MLVVLYFLPQPCINLRIVYILVVGVVSVIIYKFTFKLHHVMITNFDWLVNKENHFNLKKQ